MRWRLTPSPISTSRRFRSSNRQRMARAIPVLGFRSPRCHRWRRSTDQNLCPGSRCWWLGVGVSRTALRHCVLLERNKLDTQSAADGAAKHLPCADPFTGRPPRSARFSIAPIRSTRTKVGYMGMTWMIDSVQSEGRRRRTASARAPRTRILEAEVFASGPAIERVACLPARTESGAAKSEGRHEFLEEDL